MDIDDSIMSYPSIAHGSGCQDEFFCEYSFILDRVQYYIYVSRLFRLNVNNKFCRRGATLINVDVEEGCLKGTSHMMRLLHRPNIAYQNFA